MTNLELLNELLDNGGFTYNINTGKLTDQKGYFVALPQFQAVILGDDMYPDTITDFILQHLSQLENKNVFVGGWWNPREQKFYLDIVERYDSKEYAMRLGMMRDQKAIYDSHTEKTIYLPERQKFGTITQQVSYMNMKIRELTDHY